MAEAPLRFYLDEDVKAALSAQLRRLGYDSIDTREAGNAGFRDARQLAYSARHRRVLVTCNWNDFKMLHEAWVLWSGEWGTTARMTHSGILVLPNSRGLATETMRDAVHELVLGRGHLDNLLFRWSPSTGWREIDVIGLTDYTTAAGT